MTVVTDAAIGPRPQARAAERSLPRSAAAIAVVSVSWLLVLSAFVIAGVHGLPLLGGVNFSSLYIMNAVVWGAVSALLIARRSHPVGIILAATAIGSGISAVVAQLIRMPAPTFIDIGVLDHVLERAYLPGTLATLGVVPLLLTARPLGRMLRVIVVGGLVVSVIPLVVTVFRQRPGRAPNPTAVDLPSVQTALSVTFTAALTIMVALAVLSAIVLTWRWRWGPADDRRGVGWLVLGQWLLVLFFTPTFLPWLPDASRFLSDNVPLVPALALLFMPAAVIVSSLGRRLWGIDVAVNRMAVNVLLLVSLLLVYASIATVLTVLLPVPPTIAGAAGVAVLALGIAPLQRWIQKRVDALVYDDAAQPGQLLRRLGAGTATPGGGGDDDLRALICSLRDTLRLGQLDVRSVEPDGPSLGAGESEGPATVLPLRNDRAIVGWVTARSEGHQRVDRRTRQVLERISGVLVVALQLAMVNREIAEARDRALEVGEEERRMVRRELHDGLAPALASTASVLSGVPALLDDDPVAARRALADVRAALGERTIEVRDLARTLLPGALDAGDLGAALDELASRFSSQALTITARSSGLDALDPSRQAAVHHLVAEAVLLVRRAPNATEAALSVHVVDEVAELGVSADAAFAVGAGAAATLASIAERADDLGGALEVLDGGRGIRVAVPR
jgi:signal transduction histidine kinase